MKKILIGLGLLLSLTACQPIETGGKGSKLSDTINFEITHVHAQCDDHEEDCRPDMIVAAHVHLDATSNAGAGNNNSGGYPIDKQVDIPWEHTIYIEPGIVVKATLTITLNMQVGDKIVCDVRVNGLNLPQKTYTAKKRVEVGAQLVCGN